MTPPTCPICGAGGMIMMRDCERDRWICGRRTGKRRVTFCPGEIEMETSTMPPDDNDNEKD